MEDRYHIGVTDKLNHIDLIGYPVTVLIGSKVAYTWPSTDAVLL